VTRQNGFSLLEVAVATGLLGVAMVGILGSIGSSVTAVGTAREYDTAALIARSRMNELLTARPLPLGTTMGDRYSDGSGWEAIARPTEGFGPDGSGRQLVRISLAVWWDSGGDRKEIHLEGYRRPEGRQ